MFDAGSAMDSLRADLAERHLWRLAWLVSGSALLMGVSQWFAQVPWSLAAPGLLAALVGAGMAGMKWWKKRQDEIAFEQQRAEIERADHRLHRSDRAGRHRERAHADCEKRQRFHRASRHLAAHGNIDAGWPRLLDYKM